MGGGRRIHGSSTCSSASFLTRCAGIFDTSRRATAPSGLGLPARERGREREPTHAVCGCALGPVLDARAAPHHTCHSLPPLDDFCQRLSAHSSGRGGGQLSPSNCSASVPAPGSQRVGIAFAPIRPSVGLPLPHVPLASRLFQRLLGFSKAYEETPTPTCPFRAALRPSFPFRESFS